MLRVYLIDDENDCISILETLLNAVRLNIEIVGHAQNVKSAIEGIKNCRPDIVFLDIELKDDTGFEILNSFISKDFVTIITSAFDTYALKAIKYEAIDYLKKPISLMDLNNSLEKAMTRIKMYRQNQLQDPRNKYTRKVLVPSAESYEFIEIDKIIRIQATGSYSVIYNDDGTKSTVSKALGYFENALSEVFFIRVHHSHLINLNHVIKYVKGRCGTLIMSDSSTIEVSVRKKDEFLSRFLQSKKESY